MEGVSEEVWQRTVEKLKARTGVSADVIARWHRSKNLADVLVVQTAIQEVQHEIELERLKLLSKHSNYQSWVIIGIAAATFVVSFVLLAVALHWL